VLQQAAVIGRHFKRSLLADVSEVRPVDPHVATLRSLEFIYPTDEEESYSFRNVLAQEVAYSVLLVRRRRAYHRRVADAYERIYSGQIETHIDDLAHHYFAADIWPKALLFGRQAGDRAKGLYANPEAITHYRRCLTAIDRLEELLTSEWEEHKQPDLSDLNRDALVQQRLEIVMSLGEVQALVGSYDDALTTYQGGVELAARPGMRSELLWRMADSIHEKRAKWQDALECLARATEELKLDEPSPSLQAKIDVALSRVYWRLQRLEEARAIAETCIAQLEGTAYQAELARALKQRGIVSFMTSEFDVARDYFERGLSTARKTNDPREIIPFLQNLGVVAFRQARYADADESFRSMLAMSEETGDIYMASMALGSLGGAARSLGQLDQAIGYHERSARIKARIGDPRGVMIAYNNLAEALVDKGEPTGAIEALEKSLAIARDVQAKEKMPTILRQIAECRLALSELDVAAASAQQALDAATALGDRLEAALNTRLLGRLRVAHDDVAGAIEPLTAAADTLRGLKSDHELGVTLVDLAEALVALGRDDQVAPIVAEAEPLIGKAGSPKEKERLATLQGAVPTAIG
jgi:tetratricopeptide (TPR) repeat protein